jgi:outer membrane protein TolC
VRSALAGAGLACVLTACTPYVAKPVDVAAYPAAQDARRLDPNIAEWSQADLLAQALKANPALAEARAKRDAALAAAQAARAGPAPALTLSAEYANESPRWGYGGGLDIPLDFGARREVRLTTADLQALQARLGYAEAVWAVRTALAKAVADQAAATTEIQLAAQAVDLRRQRLAALERRVAAGEDDRNFSLVARSELAAAERRGAEAAGRQVQAAADLARALGVSPAAARSLRLRTPSAPADLDGLVDWRRQAALGRADVLRAVADYDLAEAALRLEVARQYPDVTLGPGYNWDHGVTKLPFNLALALPPLDMNRRAIASAEAARAAAGSSLEAAQANVLAGVDASAGALAAARAVAGRVREGELPAAQRAAQGAARAIKAGALDRADDLAARAAEVDARLNLLDAEHAERTAAADVEDALRRPFDPAEADILRAAVARPGETR